VPFQQLGPQPLAAQRSLQNVNLPAEFEQHRVE
jgi:hypothetical protein